jgi:hypothetical protein
VVDVLFFPARNVLAISLCTKWFLPSPSWTKGYGSFSKFSPWSRITGSGSFRHRTSVVVLLIKYPGYPGIW